MDKQKEYYTRKEVMERLAITSTNTFLRLARKYPEIFANVHQSPQRDKYPWYDKAAVDQFAQSRKHFKDHEIDE